MNRIILSISILLPCFFFNCDQKQQLDFSPGPLATTADSIGYCIGYQNASYIAHFSEDVSYPTILQGFKDQLNCKNIPLNPDVVNVMLDEFNKKMEEKKNKKMEEELRLRPIKEREFLEKNKLQTDVTTTKSGLQYKVIKTGTGRKPAPKDNIRIKYKGTFVNDDAISFSSSTNPPTIIQLNETIKGWSEALKMMNVGSTYKLFLSPELAWGDSGDGFAVDPGRTVIYELTLEGIEK